MFEAFEVGPFLIWTRVVFLLLGVWLSVEFFLRLARSARLSLDHFQEHAWWYVAAWLSAHPRVERFVIIDDQPSAANATLEPRFVKTDAACGLTQADAERCRALLLGATSAPASTFR